VIMLYPLLRLEPDEPQVVFDGTADELLHSPDPKIRQFVEGRAGSRLMELREEQALDRDAAEPRGEESGHDEDGP